MPIVRITGPISQPLVLDRGYSVSVTPLSGSCRVQIPGESVSDALTAASSYGPYSARREVVISIDSGVVEYDVDEAGGGQSSVSGAIVLANGADLAAACALAPAGAVIELAAGGAYTLSAPISLTKPLSIVGNGATLAFAAAATWAAAYVALMSFNGTVNDVAASFSTTAGASSLPISSLKITPQVGDVITLYSSDVAVTKGAYYHGQILQVVAVDATTVYFDSTFYAAYAVNRVVNTRLAPVSISDLTLDLTNVPAGDTYTSIGIAITGGAGHSVTGCQFIGNTTYSKIGILISGANSASVKRNRFRNLWNSQGINGGSGRLGYGLNSCSNNVEFSENVAINCKHPYTTASRDYMVCGQRVVGNTAVDELSLSASAAGTSGMIDVHAGCYDRAVITHNAVRSMRPGFAVRNGRAIVSENTFTRVGASTECGVFVDEAPYVDVRITENSFDFSATTGAHIVTNNWTATTAQAGTLVISENRVTGGGLLSVYNHDADLSGILIRGNTVLACPVAAVSVGILNARTVAFDVVDNYIAINSSSPEAIGFYSGSSTYKVATLKDSLIENNHIVNTAASGAPTGIRVEKVAISGGAIEANKIELTSLGTAILFATCSSDSHRIVGNNLSGGLLTIRNSLGSGTNDVYNNLDISGNLIRAATGNLFYVVETTDNIVFTNSGFRRNRLFSSTSSRGLVWVNKVGTGAWSASTQFDVVNNEIYTLSTVACVDISANSVGNKLFFSGNRLSAPITDNSSTYYRPPIGNNIVSGSQAWKGGTTVNQAGEYLLAAAPTTGTWAAGERVLFPAPVAGGYIGSVCVAAGTPGTWKSFGAIAA